MGAKRNLLIYLEKKNIKKPEFYKITGLSNGFLDKNEGVSSNIIETIVSKFSDLSIEWLVTGQGEMLRSDINNTQHTHIPTSQNQCKDTKNNSNFQADSNIINELLQRLENLSKENGRLEAENKHLREELAEKNTVLESVLHASVG